MVRVSLLTPEFVPTKAIHTFILEHKNPKSVLYQAQKSLRRFHKVFCNRNGNTCATAGKNGSTFTIFRHERKVNMSKNKYSILLPTYEEKDNLPIIVWLIVKYMNDRYVVQW